MYLWVTAFLFNEGLCVCVCVCVCVSPVLSGGTCGKGKLFPLIPTCPHHPIAFGGLYLTSVGKHQLHSMREDPQHLHSVRLARMLLEHLKTSYQPQCS